MAEKLTVQFIVDAEKKCVLLRQLGPRGGFRWDAHFFYELTNAETGKVTVCAPPIHGFSVIPSIRHQVMAQVDQIADRMPRAFDADAIRKTLSFYLGFEEVASFTPREK